MEIDLSQVELTDRHEAILRTAAITGHEYEHPEAALGESDSDYPEEPEKTDIYCDSLEEVETFYDTGRPENIQIL
jgi:hypothetical protein